MHQGVFESSLEEVSVTLDSVIEIPDQDLPALLARTNFWRAAVGVKDRLKFNTVTDQFAAELGNTCASGFHRVSLDLLTSLKVFMVPLTDSE